MSKKMETEKMMNLSKLKDVLEKKKSRINKTRSFERNSQLYDEKTDSPKKKEETNEEIPKKNKENFSEKEKITISTEEVDFEKNIQKINSFKEEETKSVSSKEEEEEMDINPEINYETYKKNEIFNIMVLGDKKTGKSHL
jgi:hypothetical protein